MRDGTLNLEVCSLLCHLSLSLEANILFQDRLVFWGTLYATPLVWGLFTVMNALTFAIFKTATTSICVLIGLVQYWGYKNCKLAHERRKKLLVKKKSKKLMKGAKKANAGLKEKLIPSQ